MVILPLDFSRVRKSGQLQGNPRWVSRAAASSGGPAANASAPGRPPASSCRRPASGSSRRCAPARRRRRCGRRPRAGRTRLPGKDAESHLTDGCSPRSAFAINSVLCPRNSSCPGITSRVNGGLLPFSISHITTNSRCHYNRNYNLCRNTLHFRE
jgi:hypothetical protein